MRYENYVELYSLRLAWWNIGLSPPTISPAKLNQKNTDYQSLLDTLVNLVVSRRLAFLGMCEISSEDIVALRALLPKESNLEIVDLTDDLKRTRFDIAVLYDRRFLIVEKTKMLFSVEEGQTIKVAQRVCVLDKEFNDSFYIFLSHWPSQILTIGGEKRRKAASHLHSHVKALLEQNHRVILMGDFNEDPHSDTLSKVLKASKCHDRSRRYSHEVFYNPFWRSIVSKFKYSYATPMDTSFHSGTMHYKGGYGSDWQSFDQIIVSGNFLGTDSWHLQESMTGVIDEDIYLNYINDTKNDFDHLPVVCELTRPEV